MDEEIEELNRTDSTIRQDILLVEFNCDEFVEDFTDNTSVDADDSLDDADNFDD